MGPFHSDPVFRPVPVNLRIARYSPYHPLPIEIWMRKRPGEAKRPVGAKHPGTKRPNAKRPGAKRLGEEMELGRNVLEECG